jgi:hypothetical protein
VNRAETPALKAENPDNTLIRRRFVARSFASSWHGLRVSFFFSSKLAQPLKR